MTFKRYLGQDGVGFAHNNKGDDTSDALIHLTVVTRCFWCTFAFENHKNEFSIWNCFNFIIDQPKQQLQQKQQELK